MKSTLFLNRFLQTSITDFGVACVFFENTSATKIASSSIRYSIRQIAFSSVMRNSAHLRPMLGIGRENGNHINSPRCNLRSNTPASILAAALNGGLLIIPCRMISGFSVFRWLFISNSISYLLYSNQGGIFTPTGIAVST